MKEVLEETHGVMVYQEQVMRILNRLGGIELANAYTCIKAISKKNLPMIAKYQEQFVAGASEAGAERKTGRRIVRADRQIRRLRLQQIAQHGLRFDRLHDGVSESALSAGVHGGAVVGRHGCPQFQEERFAGRASGRLPPHGIGSDAAGCEQIGGRFRGAEGKIVFALAAIKGCGGAAGEAIAAGPQNRRPVPQLVRFLRTVRSLGR